MGKLYQYTLLNQDGTMEVLEPCQKKEFRGAGGLYELLNCSTIEIIPSLYYKTKKWGKCTVYGDEEGRFNSENIRNPHMDVLNDIDGMEWDCVGTLVKEEVYHGNEQ